MLRLDIVINVVRIFRVSGLGFLMVINIVRISIRRAGERGETPARHRRPHLKYIQHCKNIYQERGERGETPEQERGEGEGRLWLDIVVNLVRIL